MRAWEEARRILPLEGPKIVTVGLLAGTKILTGKRRDNQLWTNPGGHMDPGETLVQAAIREVFEETGIQLKEEELELIGAERTTSFRTGKEFSIFAFIAKVQKSKTSLKNDPDQEVSEWKWVELSQDTSELFPKHRHAKHDHVLCHMGLCSSHGRLANPKTFTEKRLSDEYTDSYGDVAKEVPANKNPELDAKDNIVLKSKKTV